MTSRANHGSNTALCIAWTVDLVLPMCVEVMMRAAIVQFYKGHESVIVDIEHRNKHNYHAEEMDVFSLSVPTVVGPDEFTPKPIDLQM